MLFGLDLTEVIRTIGVLGIAGIVFAESGMMVGFFLPGDTLLFTTGFLVQQGILGINIWALVLVLLVAAVAGDNIGYSIGRKFGRRLFHKPDSLMFHQENLQKAERFYEKYGAATVIIARFMPVVRTFAPVVAGVGKMNYRLFLIFDIIGGLLWTTSITLLGYFGGAFLKSKGINVEMLVYPLIGLAVLISLGSPLYHILKDQKSRRVFLRRLGIGKKTSTD